MAKRYLLNKKIWNQNLDLRCCAVCLLHGKIMALPLKNCVAAALSPTLNLFHPPCPFRLKLLGSSMALLLRKLLMLPFSGRRWTRLLRLFWPVSFFFFLSFFCLLQTCHLPLPSVSSDLFRSLYYLELCQSSMASFLYIYLLTPTVTH